MYSVPATPAARAVQVVLTHVAEYWRNVARRGTRSNTDPLDYCAITAVMSPPPPSLGASPREYT